ncbi:uncharacterized protein Dsimw501_GD11471 [Drosophila simulans]|uniref:GD11471 n=1 Tax=Drosophila simulans TaxID=7240 RepID=B4QE51_DROSI|nr:GD11471 [Drosophila simulans]KMY95168.1 uncharacterized protein Dsimw501_GD11471 [Drosophila simulans]
MSGSEIETAADFLATPLRLMLAETEVEMYFTAGLLPSALKPRLLVVHKSTLLEHLNSLNSGYAYCIIAGQWQVAMMQQRRMYRPRLRQRNPPFDRNFY